jgi:hypothetical protein
LRYPQCTIAALGNRLFTAWAYRLGGY